MHACSVTVCLIVLLHHLVELLFSALCFLSNGLRCLFAPIFCAMMLNVLRCSSMRLLFATVFAVLLYLCVMLFNALAVILCTCYVFQCICNTFVCLHCAFKCLLIVATISIMIGNAHNNIVACDYICFLGWFE